MDRITPDQLLARMRAGEVLRYVPDNIENEDRLMDERVLFLGRFNCEDPNSSIFDLDVPGAQEILFEQGRILATEDEIGVLRFYTEESAPASAMTWEEFKDSI
jgi:hypothetical protein